MTAQRLLADSREGDEARPAFEHALLAVAIAYQLDWSFYGLRPWEEARENGEDPEGLAHRMGLEGLILRVEQALEVAVESVTR